MIEIKISGSNIYCKNGELVSGNGEGEAVFSFDKSWTGYVKTAVMFRVFGTQYSVPLQNDTCPVPSALLNGTGRLYIGVYGVSDGKTISTGFTSVEVFAGAGDGGISEPPDAYAYTRLLEMITKAVNDGESLKTETAEKLEAYQKTLVDAEMEYILAEEARNAREQERRENEAERIRLYNDIAAAEEERRLAEISREENEAERIRSCVSKSYLDRYVDGLLGDINAALDEVHFYAQSVAGGEQP